MSPTRLSTILAGRGHALRRAGWGLGDQVLSSITNFALLVIVARTVGPADVGAFALFIAGYTTLTYLSESIISEPLVVRYSGVAEQRWRAGVAAATGCTLTLGLVCVVPLVVVATQVRGPLGNLFLVGAVCAPGLLLQDTMRFAFFAHGQPQKAFINDAIWAVTQLSAVLTVRAFSQRSVAVLVLTWAAAGAVAGGIALVQAHILPRPLRARSWLRDQHDLWRFILLERLSGQGAMYLSLICIGAIAGLAAVAAVRAAQALYGPLNIAANATRIVLLPVLVRLSVDRVRRTVRLLALGLAGAAIVWGGATILMPAQVGTALFGQTWKLAAPLFVFMAVDRVAATASEGWRLGLLSLAAVKRSLFVRVIQAFATIAGAALGAAVGGARGAVIAGAIILPFGTLMFGRQFALATRLSPPQERRVGLDRAQPEPPI